MQATAFDKHVLVVTTARYNNFGSTMGHRLAMLHHDLFMADKFGNHVTAERSFTMILFKSVHWLGHPKSYKFII